MTPTEKQAARVNPRLDYFRVDPIDGYKNYGNLSAVDPPYQRRMHCDACKTKWIGCWDNFQCPECGEGELPR